MPAPNWKPAVVAPALSRTEQQQQQWQQRSTHTAYPNVKRALPPTLLITFCGVSSASSRRWSFQSRSVQQTEKNKLHLQPSFSRQQSNCQSSELNWKAKPQQHHHQRQCLWPALARQCPAQPRSHFRRLWTVAAATSQYVSDTCWRHWISSGTRTASSVHAVIAVWVKSARRSLPRPIWFSASATTSGRCLLFFFTPL